LCIELRDGLTTAMTPLWASLKRRIADLIRALDSPRDDERNPATSFDERTGDDGPRRLTS
jgi:hypothetical protein